LRVRQRRALLAGIAILLSGEKFLAMERIWRNTLQKTFGSLSVAEICLT